MWGMVHIRVYRLRSVMYYIFVIVLLVLVLFFGYRLVSRLHMKDSGDSLDQTDQNNNGKQIYLKVFNKLSDPRNILAYQMPFLSGISDNSSVETSASRGNPEERIMDAPEIFLKHEPDMSQEIKIEISKIKDDLGSITLTGEGPQILIYHTHSREAYKPDPENPYKAVEAFRCDDLDYTVVKVGDVLSRHLESKGISVLHDRTEHEQGDHATAYVRSLKTIQKRMDEYKSLKIFIDLHRNAYKEGAKSPDEEVVYINGERVAKLFVVNGTGQGYVGGFSKKPDWKENYKFAMRLTNKVNELYPGLAKPVYVKPSRYNQHVSTKAILIEVGSNLTTLKEAERAAYYLAEAISQVVA